MPSTEPKPALVHVAVGVILDERNHILIARRAADAHQGDLWEFPGGKVELQETTFDALRRELREELDLVVESSAPLLVIEHDYADKAVRLDVHVVTEFKNTAQGMEGQPLRWVAPHDLASYDFPAANAPIIDAVLEYLQ